MSLVRAVHIAAAPGKEPAVEKLLRELVPAIRAREGCQSATAIADRDERAYGLLVVWDTVAHADAAREVLGPKLMGGLQGNVREAPEISMYEVLST